MTPRILVAGIGNIFLGDDGFGVEVVRRLAERPLPDGVQVKDFGIRGVDLVYALLEDHDAVVFVDTASQGERPGTLYLIEPELQQSSEVALDAHGMDPVKVLALACALGARPSPTYLVACEPALLLGVDDEEVQVRLSEPVQAAVGEAIGMVESLLEKITSCHTWERAISLSQSSERR
jgi:hydrogenase maturation protease